MLTGAGFTHNIGTPLADGMWVLFFNHPLASEFREIRQALLADYSYESVYQGIIGGDYSPRVKEAINEITMDAYYKIDDMVISYTTSIEPSHRVDKYGLNNFIKLFSGDNNSVGYFFTLNQDLFIERHYCNGQRIEIPHLPILPAPPHSISISASKIAKEDFFPLPDKTELDNQLQSYRKQENFQYIKLHGSCIWKTSQDQNSLVIGTQKSNLIQNEPLLSYYFDVFKKVLFSGNVRLFVIGYGFGDEHINEVIAEAVRSHGLQVLVISPQNPRDFFDMIIEKPSGRIIRDGLIKYYPYTLAELFPCEPGASPHLGDIKQEIS